MIITTSVTGTADPAVGTHRTDSDAVINGPAVGTGTVAAVVGAVGRAQWRLADVRLPAISIARQAEGRITGRFAARENFGENFNDGWLSGLGMRRKPTDAKDGALVGPRGCDRNRPGQTNERWRQQRISDRKKPD